MRIQKEGEAEIKSKEELIERHLKLISPNNDWNTIKSQHATYNLTTIINGNVVNEEKQELSQRIPGLQKVVSLKNDTIANITLTNKTGSNLIKFTDGKFFGINSIPDQNFELWPVLELKQNIKDLNKLASHQDEKSAE